MEKSTCLRKKGLTSKEILHKFLQDAITANNLKMTKEAVKLGADLKEKFFYSDLYVSNKKPGKEENVHSFSGYSVLAYALSYGDYNLIKFLIDSGADPKEKLLFLTVFSSNTKIDIDILKLLINSGAKISYDEIRTIRISVDATDFKFFIKIAKLSKKELNELLLYLCSFPIGLKEKDEGFIKNHAKKVKILIEAGANAEINGNLPLILAMNQSNLELIKVITESEVDVSYDFIEIYAQDGFKKITETSANGRESCKMIADKYLDGYSSKSIKKRIKNNQNDGFIIFMKKLLKYLADHRDDEKVTE